MKIGRQPQPTFPGNYSGSETSLPRNRPNWYFDIKDGHSTEVGTSNTNEVRPLRRVKGIDLAVSQPATQLDPIACAESKSLDGSFDTALNQNGMSCIKMLHILEQSGGAPASMPVLRSILAGPSFTVFIGTRKLVARPFRKKPRPGYWLHKI